MATGLALEETELRLGLPGGGEAEAAKNPAKRSFQETVNIDLKLQLQTSPDAKQASVEVNKSASNHNVVACGSAVDGPEKPPAPKAQVVGWPPVRSFRKNILKGTADEVANAGDKSGKSPLATLVKVCMDGDPYLRKLDLKACGCYQDLSIALQKMFSSFTTGTGGMSGRDFMNERKVMDQSLCQPMRTRLATGRLLVMFHGSTPIYSRSLASLTSLQTSDHQSRMFVDSCKRLRIMKGSEAIGLAPRAMEKCKNRG